MHNKQIFFIRNLVATALVLLCSSAGATIVKLTDVPNYQWWYGVSPTVAGMMMGYYDRNGYAGLSYDDLVPGGTAELSTFPSTAGQWDYLAQSAIASAGHVQDFYVGPYGALYDDDYEGRSFDSLADFMGSSQYSAGNSNGSTTFYFFTNGAALTAQEIADYGLQDEDGMYGMWEYFDYRGYGSGSPDNNFFSQYIKEPTLTYGFTFEDFIATIDAGRPMMLHLRGTTVLGYGYDDSTDTVFFYDTWFSTENSMAWGGTYNGLEHYGVTGFIPTGGHAIPEPATLALFGLGLAGIPFVRRRRTPA